MPQTDTHIRNIYVKRVGRKLRSSQNTYLDQTLPKYDLQNQIVEIDGQKQIDLNSYFRNTSFLWLEIGFGSGEHLIHQAKLNPNIGLIGCEVYLNGIASLLGKLHHNPIPNIGLFSGDIRDLFDLLPNQCLNRVFLLYPDPWPKNRHFRRRFVNPEFLNPLAKAMKHGAELRIATDIPDYCRQTIEQLHCSPYFTWKVGNFRDWRIPWSDWISTRYELKAKRERRTPIYLTYNRD